MQKPKNGKREKKENMTWKRLARDLNHNSRLRKIISKYISVSRLQLRQRKKEEGKEEKERKKKKKVLKSKTGTEKSLGTGRSYDNIWKMVVLHALITAVMIIFSCSRNKSNRNLSISQPRAATRPGYVIHQSLTSFSLSLSLIN